MNMDHSMPIGHAKCKNEMCVALDTVEGFFNPVKIASRNLASFPESAAMAS